MDNNSWRVAQSQAQGQPQIPGQVMGGAGKVMGGEVVAPQGIDAGDWRNQLQPDSRQRIVNKIMDTLKRHLPFSGQEGLLELKKIAVRFEEKIYTAATSQSDYLRKISLKMLTMETKSQTGAANKIPQEQGSQSMQPQLQNQVQQQPNQMVSNQPQVRQQQQVLNQQNIQNNNMASSTGASNPTSSLTSQGTNMPSNVISQNPNMQQQQLDMSGVVNQSTSGNPMGGPSNAFVNSQRQIPAAGRQQQHDQFMYNQQLQQHLMKQKMQQGGGMPQSHMPSQMLQQQNQNVLQPNQLQSSQTVPMQPSLRQSAAPSSNLQQNQQQASLQQSNQSLLQPQSQNVLRQMQQQPATHLQQQQSMMHQQQNSMPTQQQQPNPANMQQNQLIGQHNGILDAQQQQQQQQRMMAQQQNNNISNLQQQSNVPNAHQQSNSGQQNLHQQQIGQNNNISGFQNQQMAGLQHGNSGMQTNQQQPGMLLQNKVTAQQQMQQNMANMQQNLLPNQAQQSQSQPPQQQQMMSQIQSQPGQLQQQLGLQQRMQNPGSLLQQQNTMDQQRQLLQQSQRMPDAPLNSSSHSGNTSGDWQEEIYQKIKSMNEKYFPELNEMFQRMANKLQHVDAPLQQPKNEQVEKLRFFVVMLEKLIIFLRTNKNDIVPGHRDKSAAVEKQIVSILSSNRPKKPVSSLQQQPGQVFSQSHMHSMHQQSQQPQMHEQMNSQMNVQTPPQHNSNTVNNSRQNIMDPSLDSGQGNSMNSMQQGAMNSMQQSSIMSSVASASQPMQSNGNNSLQVNPNLQVKQEQQIYTTQQMKQQQFQRVQQQQQQQQLMQRQQLLQQQQNNQMNDTQDIKMRPQQQIRQGVLQQNQRPYMAKPGTSFSISSPQLFQSGSPQIGHHPSPQLDQHNNMSNSQIKVGTPLQQANSPFIVPSPSISMVPSPLPGGDLEKINPSLLNTGNNNVQHHSNAGASVQAQSLAIGTPGISASPLLAEFTSPDGTTHGATSTVVPGNSTAVELPLDRFIKAVRSMSPKALTSLVNDIGSVVSMVDRFAGSAPGNGSRAAVGEDLAATTKCRLQARNFFTQDGPSGTTKKMRRYISAVPSNVVSSTGSVTDNMMYLNGCESDGESTGVSSIKKPKLEVNYALQEELREINERLIDTVVYISEDDVDPTAVAAATEGGEGTIVKCNFRAVALSPNLKSQYESAQMSPIQPLRLLIPSNYPNCSPVLLEKSPVEISREYEDLSLKAKSRFSISLRALGQPMSLGEIARTWDVCARAVITEYAQQSGGGTFSSKYGTWQNCA